MRPGDEQVSAEQLKSFFSLLKVRLNFVPSGVLTFLTSHVWAEGLESMPRRNQLTCLSIWYQYLLSLEKLYWTPVLAPDQLYRLAEPPQHEQYVLSAIQPAMRNVWRVALANDPRQKQLTKPRLMALKP